MKETYTDKNGPSVFRSESILDLPAYNEVMKGLVYTTTRTRVFQIFLTIFYLAAFIILIVFPHIAGAFLFGSIVGLSFSFIKYLKNRKGDKGYKLLLSENAGQPPYRIFTFDENGINCFNSQRNTHNTFLYTHITRFIETPRFFILLTECNHYLAVDALWLTGGTKQEFRDFLSSHTPTSSKKASSYAVGKRLFNFSRASALAAVALALVLFLIQNYAPGNVHFGPCQLPNNLSYQQVADELEKFDIQCSHDSILELEESEASWREYDYFSPPDTQDRIISCMSMAGFGTYDMDALEWIPPEGGVYWFDTEAFLINSMYSNYLKGILSLYGSELTVSNIVESQTELNTEHGTGFSHLSFELNGRKHNVLATLNYDWMDPDAIEKINKIICAENTEKQLYFIHDGGQGFIVLYRSEQWAKDFTDLTGIPLCKDLDTALSAWYNE